MKNIAGAIIATIILLVGSPAVAQVLTEDYGRCAAGLVAGHAGHEWGHQLSGLKHDGKSWAPPLSLWGNQWDESQKDFREVAMGGFAGQHVFAAMGATMADDPYGRCIVYADIFSSFFYAFRAKLQPDNSGDYDPFSTARRREITMTNVGASLLLGGMASRLSEDKYWLSSRPLLFDFNAEFYRN